MKSKFKSDLLYQTIFQIVSIILPLITSPILSRRLGADGLGEYSYTYSLVSYFILFAQLGVVTYGMRTISQSKTGEISSTFWGIYLFQVLSSILALIGYFVFCFLYSYNNPILLFANAFYLFGELINISWLYFGVEKYKYTVIKNLVIKIVSFILIVVLIRDPEDLAIYVFILAASSFLSNLTLWFGIKKIVRFVPFEEIKVKKHIRNNLILFIPLLASSVYHIMDKTMLGILSTESESGYYYSADKLLSIPLTLITGLGNVFLTKISSFISSGDEESAKQFQKNSILFCALIIAPVSLGISAVSKEFIPIFFGSGFEPCIKLAYVFSAVIIVKALSTFVRSAYLIPSKNDRIYVISVIVGAVLNIVANLYLIKVLNLGAMGAAVGTLVAEVSVFVFQILLLIRKDRNTNLCVSLLCSLPYIGFAILMMISACLLQRFEIGPVALISVKVLIGAVTYALLCIVYWIIWPSMLPSFALPFISKLKGFYGRFSGK